MKILVLTSEDDDYDYPVDCVVQGQVSNIKLKEILTSMANGSALPDSEPLDDENEQEGSRLPRRIKLNSRELDKLSASSMTNRRFGFKSIHINPIILAGAAAGVLVIVVIVLAVMKGMSSAGQAATSDEAATTAPFFLFDTQPSAEPTTEDYTYPTLFPQPPFLRLLRPNQLLRRKPFLRQHIPRKSRQPRRRQAIHRRAAVLLQAAETATAATTAVAAVETAAVRRAVSPKLRFTAATPLCPTTTTEDTAIRAATPSAKSSSITAPKRFRLTTRCN